MTNMQQAEDFQQVEANPMSEPAAQVYEKAVEDGKAKASKAQAANANRWGMQREVKGHLLGAMIGSLDDCPKGDSGRQYGETVIARLSAQWGVDETGNKLSEAEVLDIQATIPGTKAYKARQAAPKN